MIGHALEAFTIAVIGFVAVAGAALWHPSQRVTCPPGWYIEGVRPSGRTQCRPTPPPSCGEPVPPNNAPCAHDERTIPLELYCTGGSVPIVVNERVAGCQARH